MTRASAVQLASLGSPDTTGSTQGIRTALGSKTPWHIGVTGGTACKKPWGSSVLRQRADAHHRSSVQMMNSIGGPHAVRPVRHHTPRPAFGRCAMGSSFPWPPWSLLDPFELQGFKDRDRAAAPPTERLIAELNNGAGAGPLLLRCWLSSCTLN